jgi:hypothetical protein
MVMMNQIPKKHKILHMRQRSKSSKPIERKTTKQKPSFIMVLMKPYLRLLLPQKHQKKYGRLSNKNTKVLIESRRFVSNLCEMNLNYYK